MQGQEMASKKNVEQRRRINKIMLDQRTVNAGFCAVTGRSAREAGLKMADKIDAVMSHFGIERLGPEKAKALHLAADAVRRFMGQKDVAPAKKVSVTLHGRDFYDGWEWKAARFLALKLHGRRCQCCGWSPGSSAGNYLVVDHIKPLRTHPSLALDPNNHQVLCNDCNMGKSYKHHDDFRP